MSLTPTSASNAEFQALTRERDPELRGEGLLSLAARQERAHRRELAIEIYRELASSTDIPNALRDRAQGRLDAYGGQGAIGARAEILLSRFSEEATEPTTLLAMTAAGLAFRASRFLTLSRLASSPSAGLFTRGLGARTLAGLTGFGVEAAVFPLAGRLGNTVLGREQDWSLRALRGELASSFLMLGALRAGGLATGALASRTNFFRPLLQQTGMYGGILLGQELEVRAGLRERTSAGITMIDGLSTLVQFNVAGRLNRNLFGEGLGHWEQRIEQQSEALSRPTWRLPLFPQLGLQAAWSQAGTGPRSMGRAEEILPDRLYMSGEHGNGNGNGPRRPRDNSNNTLPFITLHGVERSPYEVRHPLEIGRRMGEEDKGFENRIREVDVEFEVKSIYDVEPYIPTLLEKLNRMTSRNPEVKTWHSVILNVHPMGEVRGRRIRLEHGANGYERAADGTRLDTPVLPPRAADPLAKTVFAVATPALEPAPRSEPLAAVRPTPPPKPARPLPLLTSRTEDIPQLLLRLTEGKAPGEGTPTLIVEGHALEVSDLQRIMEGWGPRFPENASFDVMVPESQMTYSGLRLGEGLKWLPQYSMLLEWKAAIGRAVMPRIDVGSTTELYRQIYALGRKSHRLPEAETVLRLQGELPPEGLGTFTLQALNRYSVVGRAFRVETENNGSHDFLGEDGRWRSAEAPARAESKPASRPPLTGIADQYHTARWRTDLTQFLQEPKSIVGRHHEFFLSSQLPFSANDIQAIRQRLLNGAGDLELLRLHDQAGQRVWSFQRQGSEWTVEEGVWENQLRWRPFGNNPQGAVEAGDLMDLLRQLPGTAEGTEPLHILMRGPWSAQYAVSFLEVLNQSGQPSLRPSLELHYESPQAEPRRQVYQRNSHGEWHFLEASEGT